MKIVSFISAVTILLFCGVDARAETVACDKQEVKNFVAYYLKKNGKPIPSAYDPSDDIHTKLVFDHELFDKYFTKYPVAADIRMDQWSKIGAKGEYSLSAIQTINVDPQTRNSKCAADVTANFGELGIYATKLPVEYSIQVTSDGSFITVSTLPIGTPLVR